jgi:hypothetical protein
MGARRSSWLLVMCVVIGTALGGVGGACYSAAQPKPDLPFQSNTTSQQAQLPPRPAIEPMFVIDGALCGFVLGAGFGALVLRSRANR